MDKITELSLEEKLISFWKKGWPEYVIKPSDDYPSIIGLFNQVAEYLNLKNNETDFDRCCQAIQRIAYYCRNNMGRMRWAERNLHFYNRAFQTLEHEMSARKRIASQNYSWNKK